MEQREKDIQNLCTQEDITFKTKDMKKFEIFTTEGQATNTFFMAVNEKQAVKLASEHFGYIRVGKISGKTRLLKEKYTAVETDSPIPSENE